VATPGGLLFIVACTIFQPYLPSGISMHADLTPYSLDRFSSSSMTCDTFSIYVTLRQGCRHTSFPQKFAHYRGDLESVHIVPCVHTSQHHKRHLRVDPVNHFFAKYITVVTRRHIQTDRQNDDGTLHVRIGRS